MIILTHLLLAAALVVTAAALLVAIMGVSLWVDWIVTVPLARLARALAGHTEDAVLRALPPTLRPAVPAPPRVTLPPILLPRVPDGVRPSTHRRGRR